MRFLFALPFLVLATFARATDCPNPGEPCKVLTLTDNEISVLMGEKGILATAAQARNLDLGAAATYFQTRIANAPAGVVKPKEESKSTPAEAPKK